MPIPLIPAVAAIAGATVTTAISTVIATAVSVIGGFVVRFFTARVGTRLIALGLIASIAGAGIVATIEIVSQLRVITPPQWSQAISLVVPDNSAFSVWTIVACKIVRWAYAWKFYVIEKLSG
ncbi:hypothetical protein ATY37_06525 [Vibrio cidicii]|uniref:Uncharacterized protein n=1 Tax=Vibrio cidicii TaxID=1763883 RepID=A0A151KTV3_9VIBR|nr:DUF5455 family protein [Vibrio cidicii]KYN81826.1 hypothetical protein ATY37_06525 [Vibrio cidicii]